MPEALELRSRCSQLEEQVEQQQKIIRYLQGQQGGAGRVSMVATVTAGVVWYDHQWCVHWMRISLLQPRVYT
jgi:hypothetical protein